MQLTYDANGNLITDQEGRTLVYDAWNRLVEVKSGATTLQRYEYDALKRRVEEDGTKLFYSAQWQVLEERDAATDHVTAQYVWSPVYVDAMILRDRDANANPADGLEQRHYVQYDANFNVTAITDPTGTVVERYLYDPYGQATVLDANWQPTTGNHAWQYLHQGGRYDPATTLHHFRNRDYAAELGRWVQQDPLGYVNGANAYQALLSNSVAYVDPFGTDAYVKADKARHDYSHAYIYVEVRDGSGCLVGFLRGDFNHTGDVSIWNGYRDDDGAYVQLRYLPVEQMIGMDSLTSGATRRIKGTIEQDERLISWLLQEANQTREWLTEAIASGDPKSHTFKPDTGNFDVYAVFWNNCTNFVEQGLSKFLGWDWNDEGILDGDGLIEEIDEKFYEDGTWNDGSREKQKKPWPHHIGPGPIFIPMGPDDRPMA